VGVYPGVDRAVQGVPQSHDNHMTRLLRQPGDVELTPPNWGTAETHKATGIEVHPDSTIA